MRGYSFSTSASAAALTAALLCSVLAANAHPTAEGSTSGVVKRRLERDGERGTTAAVFDDRPLQFRIDPADDGSELVLGMSAGAARSAGLTGDQAPNDGSFVGATVKVQPRSFRPLRWLLLATQQKPSLVASPARPRIHKRSFNSKPRKSNFDQIKTIIPKKEGNYL